MTAFNPYFVVIIISVLIIISYIFNTLSRKYGVPSVLMLISLGVIANIFREDLGFPNGEDLFNILEVIGIIGLIMIVLEAALDLELNKSKWPVIWKSFSVALLSLVIGSLFIGAIIHFFIVENFIVALLYAIPLSIMSSAIIIPSVGELSPDKREFMIYESTFSDILGIMYFYFLIANIDNDSAPDVILDVSFNILFTIGLSITASYILVLVFQKLKSQVKLFLLMAVLLLFYSIGKLFHLSSLLIILIFGLVLNNYRLFFRGRLAKLLDIKSLHAILSNFHLITMETAFVIRTLFFFIFGYTINLSALKDFKALIYSLIIVFTLFLVRTIFLKLFNKNTSTVIALMAPRGLITILLLFAIPNHLVADDFNSAIYLYTILITSSIMAGALISAGKHLAPVDALQLEYWRAMDEEIEKIPEQTKHQEPDETN